jgi:hypothetical protein
MVMTNSWALMSSKLLTLSIVRISLEWYIPIFIISIHRENMSKKDSQHSILNNKNNKNIEL